MPCRAAQSRRRRETHQADQQRPFPPDQVGQAPARQQQSTERQGVGGHHPLPVAVREAKRDLRVGQRDVDHRRVENDHQLHQRQHREDPPAAFRHGIARGGVRGGAGRMGGGVPHGEGRGRWREPALRGRGMRRPPPRVVPAVAVRGPGGWGLVLLRRLMVSRLREPALVRHAGSLTVFRRHLSMTYVSKRPAGRTGDVAERAAFGIGRPDEESARVVVPPWTPPVGYRP
ncbi:hypothetical protein FAIPA1_310011 [Frankia sp. AiPs1]